MIKNYNWIVILKALFPIFNKNRTLIESICHTNITINGTLQDLAGI